MELSQLQRRSILTAWRTYQDAVHAARQQSHQKIDVLREQAEKWALQEQEPQAGSAYGGPGHTEAAAEVRMRCWLADCEAGRQTLAACADPLDDVHAPRQPPACPPSSCTQGMHSSAPSLPP
jgi:hypothetical protein